jgi:hypothetical protein
MSVVRDFLGNEITPGATVVYATVYDGGATLRKGTVISVSPRLLVRVKSDGKARTAWVRDPRRVVVVQ